jgi:hypothetical protein
MVLIIFILTCHLIHPDQSAKQLDVGNLGNVYRVVFVVVQYRLKFTEIHLDILYVLPSIAVAAQLETDILLHRHGAKRQRLACLISLDKRFHQQLEHSEFDLKVCGLYKRYAFVLDQRLTILPRQGIFMHLL